jgi:hypothetical protein
VTEEAKFLIYALCTLLTGAVAWLGWFAQQSIRRSEARIQAVETAIHARLERIETTFTDFRISSTSDRAAISSRITSLEVKTEHVLREGEGHGASLILMGQRVATMEEELRLDRRKDSQQHN